MYLLVMVNPVHRTRVITSYISNPLSKEATLIASCAIPKSIEKLLISYSAILSPATADSSWCLCGIFVSAS